MNRSPLRQYAAVAALLFAAFGWAGDKSAYPSMTIGTADVANTVRAFINEEARAHDGFCRINDPVENATLDLRLKDVYTEKLMKVQPNTFVACATLETAAGTAYDVDFYLKGTTPQNLKVVDVSIHAKNGVQRYAWVDEKGLVKVKAISSEMPMRGELAH
jgi:hypothetical protein